MRSRRRFALALVALLIATQATSAANPRSVRAVPPDIRYGYDAVGRLKGVTDLNGNSATYNYDAVGNITSITNSPASTVSIWSFSPLSGAIGGTVRISGTGFSATPSQNTVKFFNNKTATVTSASASVLVVTVPTGATTGVIKVTVGASTATSADNFTVGTAPAPTITSLSASSGLPGASITITGTKYETVTTNNDVLFNVTRAKVTSATATQLVTSVPRGASGKVTVRNPGGEVTFATDFFSPPTGYVLADMSSTGRITIGTSANVTVSAANKYGMRTFAGTRGQRISVTGSTPNSTKVSVLRHDGSTFRPFSSVTGTYFLDVMTLPVDADYAVIVDPDASNTGTTSVLVRNVPADASAALTLGGPSATLTTTVPGQNAYATFAGTATHKVSVQLSALTMGSSDVSIERPDGIYMVVPTFVTGDKFFDTMTLPLTGTYKIFVNPRSSPTGNVTLQAWDVPADASGTLTIGGSAQTLTTTVPGQNAYATFDGTQNQNVSMQLSGLTMGFTDVSVQKPDGSDLIVPTFVTGDKFFDTFTLPVNGTYKVFVNPRDGGVGNVTLRLYEVPADASGTLTIGGSSLTLTTTVPGQNAFATFDGAATQLIRLVCSAVTISQSDVSILKPDGSPLVGPVFVNTSGCTIDTQLTVAGTYKIVVNPRDNFTGSMTLTLTERTGMAPEPAQIGAAGSSVAGLTRAGGILDMGAGAWARPAPAAEPPPALQANEPPEEWIPGPGNLRGDWRSGRPHSRWQNLPPLRAAKGITAVSGQALRLNGLPLAGVTLSIASATTVTDRNGQFLLKDIPDGRRQLQIDGSTANQGTRTYGFFVAKIDVRGGETNILPYTIWMPKLDTRHTVTISSPTTAEVVLKTPYIPGLEVHIPKGAVLKDRHGAPVTEIGITPIPVDRAPFALPNNVEVPIYFTVQPGGAYVYNAEGKYERGFGARITYPNYRGDPPGSLIQFYNYDPRVRGWYVYGVGNVSTDGKRVVPKPGVVVYQFNGAMIDGIGPPSTWPVIGGLIWGDPVDLATGIFVLRKNDLVLPDVIPLALTRTYRPNDSTVRAFGRGSAHPYSIYLWSALQYQEADLILPDGGRVHYVRVSPGTDYTDAVFQHTITSGPFYRSTIRWNGQGWDLRLRNGTVLVFGDNAPLQAIRDRNGNELTVLHSNGQAGNVTYVRSPNGRWIEFTYDASNRVTRAEDNIGRAVVYEYDASGRIWKVTDPKGGITEYTYDTSHRMLTLKDPRSIVFLTNHYDANGRVDVQTQADSSTYQYAYTLDGNGKVTQTDVTDPRGKVRRVTFTGNGYVVTDTRAQGSSLAQTVTYERDPTSNRVTAITDARGRRTDLGYDSLGNLTTETRLAGTPDAVTTTATYSSAFSQLASITDPLNHTKTYGFDGNGNVNAVTDELNKSWTLAYNSLGQLASITNPLTKSTTFSYKSGDLVGVTDALNNASKRFVDPGGRLTVATDALGLQRRYVYDALDRLTSEADPRGGLTSLTYDGNGDLLTLTDARTNAWNWSYNNMDRIATRTDPLTRIERREYDSLGNLTKVTDQKNQVTTYRYDDLGRWIFAGFATTGTPPNETYASSIDYTYDTGNRLTQAVDSVAGTITFGYDELDRRTSETNARGSLAYVYDVASRRSSMTVAGQAAVTYSYDDADRLTQVAKGTLTTGITYDDAGRRTRLTLPDGISVDYGYDDASRLTALTYKLGQATLGDLAYTYDPARHRTGVSGSFARAAIPAAVSSATYDIANELTAWAGTTISYDANGSLTSDGSSTYTWNARNQLSSITGATAASFTYDAFGRRTQRTVAGATVDHLYDGLSTVQELTAGSPSANLLSGGLDEVFLRTDSAGDRSFLPDALRSTIALADGAGALQTSYTYDPFGKRSASGQANTNTFQFTGRETDTTTLLYYRARYYNPSLQRFIAQDPIGFAAGDVNLYAYLRDDPVNSRDPLGLWTAGLCGGFVRTFIFAYVGQSACIVVSERGQIGLTLTSEAAGAIATPGVSGNVGFQYSDAESLEDLRHGYETEGFSAGARVVAGGERFWGGGHCDQLVQGGNVGVGPGVGAEYHRGASDTILLARFGKEPAACD